MKRAGILLPIASLNGGHGIGDFGESAYKFIDVLKSAGQSFWQVLPIGYVGYGYSPYQCYSSDAINPYYIDLNDFVKSGLLTADEIGEIANGEYVDYEAVYAFKDELFDRAFGRFKKDDEYFKFVKGCAWVTDFAIFVVALKSTEHLSIREFPKGLLMRDKCALDEFMNRNSHEIEREIFLQYVCHSQWFKLKAYANASGVSIIGDIPIYLSYDSVEVWKNRELFLIDDKFEMEFVSGVPGDAMCADGQVWGNPLYDWEYHKKNGFKWWLDRIGKCLNMYDYLRLDHFIGFVNYFKVPKPFKTAIGGEWADGYADELFEKVVEIYGKDRVLAEDLGTLTEKVSSCLKRTGFRGMKLLQFAFDGNEDNTYLPKNYPENCVAYTGTHDNDTLKGWLSGLSECSFELFDKLFPNMDKERIAEEFICYVLNSAADMAIIPLQDYLGLSSEARINTPSTVGSNWKWRMTEINGSAADFMKRAVKESNREPI